LTGLVQNRQGGVAADLGFLRFFRQKEPVFEVETGSFDAGYPAFHGNDLVIAEGGIIMSKPKVLYTKQYNTEEAIKAMVDGQILYDQDGIMYWYSKKEKMFFRRKGDIGSALAVRGFSGLTMYS
jgi:hypothetical protein